MSTYGRRNNGAPPTDRRLTRIGPAQGKDPGETRGLGHHEARPAPGTNGAIRRTTDWTITRNSKTIPVDRTTSNRRRPAPAGAGGVDGHLAAITSPTSRTSKRNLPTRGIPALRITSIDVAARAETGRMTSRVRRGRMVSEAAVSASIPISAARATTTNRTGPAVRTKKSVMPRSRKAAAAPARSRAKDKAKAGATSLRTRIARAVASRIPASASRATGTIRVASRTGVPFAVPAATRKRSSASRPRMQASSEAVSTGAVPASRRSTPRRPGRARAAPASRRWVPSVVTGYG